MQLILLENIIKLGKIGDQVEVKNGYGRNFLLKTGKALRANKDNIELVNKKKDELNKKNNEIKKEFKEIANKINNKSLIFNREAKENGELFGSIKPKEISNAFLSDLKIEISPSQIDLKQEINKIGKYQININLHSEVSATVSLNVSKTDSSNIN
jgi:large subunit ribosomal protein L9